MPTDIAENIQPLPKEAVITKIDGRKITFSVKAYDGIDEIGSGTHERFIVNKAKFQSKADGKLST